MQLKASAFRYRFAYYHDRSHVSHMVRPNVDDIRRSGSFNHRERVASVVSLRPLAELSHSYLVVCQCRVIAAKGREFIALNMGDDDLYWSSCFDGGATSLITRSIIVGILVIFGIVGNGLTFAVFWKGNTDKSTSFLFMCLSLIDSGLMLSAFSILATEFATFRDWLPEYLDKLYPYQVVYVEPLIETFKSVTSWLTVLLTVNRYIIVCRPFKESQWCTVSKVKIQLAVVLLLAVFCNIPRFAEKRIHIYLSNNDTTSSDTSVTWVTSEPLKIYGNVLDFVFVLVLPIIVVTVLTIRLIKVRQAYRRSQKEVKIARNDRSVTFVLVIVVIVFVICQLFALIDQILLHSKLPGACGTVQFYMWRISNILTIFNSGANFFIFFIFNKRFRDVLAVKVCMRRREQATGGGEVQVSVMIMNWELADTSM